MRVMTRAATAAVALCAATGYGVEAAPAPRPTAVVALLDTGINPYHAAFRDRSPRARQHPSTYLPGYPKNAVALPVTLDAKDFWEAVHKDCARVWSKVRPNTLYWFPGTKIVGAISFTNASPVDCGSNRPAPVVLDRNGHGTMTASRAAGTPHGACPDCRIVAAQFSGSAGTAKDALAGVQWATANAGWIDTQSHSWGAFVPGWVPTNAVDQLYVSSPAIVRAAEASGRAHLAFWASGNGAAFRGGVLGHPTPLTPWLTPSVLSVGGLDSGQVNTWPGFPPHAVSDSCSSWAASATSTTEWRDSLGGGTSAATPFVAGGAGAILADARALLRDTRTGVRGGAVVASGRRGAVTSGPLADGVFTLAEWREVVLKTATRRPVRQPQDGPPCGVGPYGPTPVRWDQVPDGYPEYLHIGYGAVDKPAVALAAKVLRGTAPMPVRTATDEYFTRDRQVREATYQVWSTGP